MGGSHSKNKRRNEQLSPATISEPLEPPRGQSVASMILSRHGNTNMEINRKLVGMSQKAPPPFASPSAKLLLRSKAAPKLSRDYVLQNEISKQNATLIAKSDSQDPTTQEPAPGTSSATKVKALVSCLKKPKPVSACLAKAPLSPTKSLDSGHGEGVNQKSVPAAVSTSSTLAAAGARISELKSHDLSSRMMPFHEMMEAEVSSLSMFSEGSSVDVDFHSGNMTGCSSPTHIDNDPCILTCSLPSTTFDDTIPDYILELDC